MLLKISTQLEFVKIPHFPEVAFNKSVMHIELIQSSVLLQLDPILVSLNLGDV